MRQSLSHSAAGKIGSLYPASEHQSNSEVLPNFHQLVGQGIWKALTANVAHYCSSQERLRRSWRELRGLAYFTLTLEVKMKTSFSRRVLRDLLC